MLVTILLFVFLVGIRGLSTGFKDLGQDLLDAFFQSTENPFIGLMVGILATTMAQSSSVTTSLIVGLVAAPENALPVANAVPMIMGANIGTTVTNTIVSLAHMSRRDEFGRAFAVATCHDFFNYIAVLVLLPIEMATGVLRHTAELLTRNIGGVGGLNYESPLKGAIKLGLKPIESMIDLLPGSPKLHAVLLILVSVGLIFLALTAVVKVLRSAMQARVEGFIERALGKSLVLSVMVGIVVTVMVQSSSITTSLLVPLAGAGILTIQRAFPITVGANIGTTITALLAWMGTSGVNSGAGLTIALVHLLFNLTAMFMILPHPRIREVPIALAKRLAAIAVESPRWAVLYIVMLFYGLPALVAVLDRVF